MSSKPKPIVALEACRGNHPADRKPRRMGRKASYDISARDNTKPQQFHRSVQRIVTALILFVVFAQQGPFLGAGAEVDPTRIKDDDEIRELRITGEWLYWIDESKQTVFKARVLIGKQGRDFVATPARFLSRHEAVLEPPDLLTPSGLAVDPRGTVYVTDPLRSTVWRVPLSGALQRLVVGPPLDAPSSIVYVDGSLFVADSSQRQIYQLDARNGTALAEPIPIEEFSPSLLAASGSTILVFEKATKRLSRLFVASRDPGVSALSPRLRRGEAIDFNTPIGNVDDLSAADGLVYFLDSAEGQLRVLSTAAGELRQLDLRKVLKKPSALCSSLNSIFVADKIEQIMRLPLVVPSTFYLSGGLPDESLLDLYEYLHSRRLLPLQKHIIQPNDSISGLARRTGVLTRYLEAFSRLFCKLNQAFCTEQQAIPAVYQAGASINLPDLPMERYVTRREFSLPLDESKYPGAPFRQYFLKGRTVGALASGLVSSPEVLDHLEKTLLEMNYTYSAANILGETRGLFVIPVDAIRVSALVVAADLNDPTSPLSAIVSKSPANTTLSGPVRALFKDEGTFSGVPVRTENAQPESSTIYRRDERCSAVPEDLWSKVLQAVRYCLPKDVRTADIVVVDNEFDASHPEFAAVPDGRLRYYYRSNSNIIRTPLGNQDQENFDTAADHGTHISGLIAASGVGGRFQGIHPQAIIHAVQPGNFWDFSSRYYRLNTYNLSLGESSFGPKDLDNIKKVILEQSQVLFVVAAGNDGLQVSRETLAGLGDLNNVLVVGSAQLGSTPPTMLPSSNYGKDYVSIVAPGDRLTSTVYGGNYGVSSGTSQATALVSGTAAILRGTNGKAWAPWQIKQRIMYTADLWKHGHADTDKVFSGMLNIERAVLDCDRAVLRFVTDPDVAPCDRCKGEIAPEDLDNEVVIQKAHSSPIRFSLADLRRLLRQDGQYTLIYSVGSGESDRHEPRLRCVTVPGGSIASVSFRMFPRTQACPDQITLLDLEELVNVFY